MSKSPNSESSIAVGPYLHHLDVLFSSVATSVETVALGTVKMDQLAGVQRRATRDSTQYWNSVRA